MHHLHPRSPMASHAELLAQYREMAAEVKQAVLTARSGDYKTGYLSFLVKALEMLKQAGEHLPECAHERPMIDKLIAGFTAELHGPVDSGFASLMDDPVPHNPK